MIAIENPNRVKNVTKKTADLSLDGKTEGQTDGKVDGKVDKTQLSRREREEIEKQVR